MESDSQLSYPLHNPIHCSPDLTDEFGTDDGGFQGELPEGRHCRVENKNFYFDIGQVDQGILMISAIVMPGPLKLGNQELGSRAT